MFQIRQVRTEDAPFWLALDEHLRQDEFARKVRDGQGYEVIMTSIQVDEEAQHFYRKLGYVDR